MTNSSATPDFDLRPPSEAQLRKLIDGLGDEERRVVLHHGDEEPFCGVFLAEKREGVFTCRLCGLPLFKAGTKFESGTGWPSFTAPFDEDHLRRVRDARYATETFEICARCGAQQGTSTRPAAERAGTTAGGSPSRSGVGLTQLAAVRQRALVADRPRAAPHFVDALSGTQILMMLTPSGRRSSPAAGEDVVRRPRRQRNKHAASGLVRLWQRRPPLPRAWSIPRWPATTRFALPRPPGSPGWTRGPEHRETGPNPPGARSGGAGGWRRCPSSRPCVPGTGCFDRFGSRNGRPRPSGREEGGRLPNPAPLVEGPRRPARAAIRDGQRKLLPGGRRSRPPIAW